jgi:hypothetical protein
MKTKNPLKRWQDKTLGLPISYIAESIMVGTACCAVRAACSGATSVQGAYARFGNHLKLSMKLQITARSCSSNFLTWTPADTINSVTGAVQYSEIIPKSGKQAYYRLRLYH